MDPHIRVGEEFADKIERALWECQHVIVLWSPQSVESRWVRIEAEQAKKLGKLLPVIIEDCEIPYGFKALHTVRLERRGGWGPLLEKLYEVIGGGGYSIASYAVHDAPMRAPSAPPMASPAPPREMKTKRSGLIALVILALVIVTLQLAQCVMTNEGPSAGPVPPPPVVQAPSKQ